MALGPFDFALDPRQEAEFAKTAQGAQPQGLSIQGFLDWLSSGTAAYAQPDVEEKRLSGIEEERKLKEIEAIWGTGAGEGKTQEEIDAELERVTQVASDELERQRKVVEYVHGAEAASWETDDAIRGAYAEIVGTDTGSVLATMSLEDINAAIATEAEPTEPPDDGTEVSAMDQRLIDAGFDPIFDIPQMSPVDKFSIIQLLDQQAEEAEAEGEDVVLGDKAQFVEDQFGEGSTEGMTAGDIQELWMSLQTPAEAPTDPAGYGFEWQYDPGSNQYVKVPLGWEAQLAQQEFLSNPINFLQAAMFESGLDPDQQRYSGLFPEFLAGMTPGVDTGTATQDVLGKSFGVTTPSARGYAMLDPTQKAQLNAWIGSSMTPRSLGEFGADVSNLAPPKSTGFLQR